VKRIHEYKRQHLNVLYLITLYNRLRNGLDALAAPRTVIFGGKAAPGYRMAKLMIRLITAAADVINNDPTVAGRLKIVFLPDFNVTSGQRVYPAADLSEQISTAGKEASGTGNMKFAMNGALTIGTLDGANVEIRDAVGPENFFLFGLSVENVARVRAEGYSPRRYYDSNPELREVIDLIAGGAFTGGNREVFAPLVESLLNRDEYLLFADYQPYVECQERVGRAYQDQDGWTRMSILNTARCGYFSSDRAIREYCDEIWRVSPIEVPSHDADDEATRRLGQPVAGVSADRPRLSPEEEEQLRDLPLLVGLDVTHATRGWQGRMAALATAVASPTATARFLSRGALVQMLVSSEVEMIERSERLFDDVERGYDLRTRDGRAKLHDDVLARCRAAIDLLSSRVAPADVAEFARWLLLVGQRVAEASIDPQPGRAERQVSDAEAAALREIAAALRVET
jgi:hypothetical protein